MQFDRTEGEKNNVAYGFRGRERMLESMSICGYMNKYLDIEKVERVY